MASNNINNSMAQEEEEEEVCRVAMQLASYTVLPMALRAAIELDLLELINKSDHPTISASELASQLPTNNSDATTMIDRILRLLAAHSILTCARGVGLEFRYGMTSLSKFFTRNEDGFSVPSYLSLLTQDRTFMEAWYHLKDAVLDGGVPFNRAHGMGVFEYAAIDPSFNQLFNRAMSESSIVFVKKVLEKYNGFEGVESLVDVGGGIGTSLKMILSKYPSIKGINFDLPHVLEHAISYPEVENIGGDMFVSVPKADAIFMKWICHDWSDEHCKKLLKNCYEALPENGKVIVAETIFPEDPNSSGGGSGYTRATQLDVFMMSFNVGGKERTEKEFQALGEDVGFKEVIKICYAFNIWIIEFRK